MKKSNRSILFSTYIFLVVFIAMIGYVLWYSVAKAGEDINNSYNHRQEIMAENTIRGSILTADGKEIAVTLTDENGEYRYYPGGRIFAHVAGYINNGGYGLEKTMTYYLLQSNDSFIDNIINDITGSKSQGDNVVTTLDYGLSEAAYNALGNNSGAVIITEPSTGKILAMVSKPDFNPNTLSEEWAQITSDKNNSQLVNRATQGLYPPGSTFKLITMLEYIRENKNTYMDYSYICSGAYEIGESVINCNHKLAHGEENLIESFANSCNSSFINMGLSLDINKLRDTAEELLLNKELPYPLEYNKSQFVLSDSSSDWDIAQSSFGQGKTLITPLQLALITSAIANDGVLMNPILVTDVNTASGNNVKHFKISEYGRLMSASEAEVLTEAMSEAAKTSYSWLFTDAGYEIAGKTGTAQYGNSGYEHSLFTSFSPVDSPEIAVTVVIEGGEQRDASAIEVAKKIYDYYNKR